MVGDRQRLQAQPGRLLGQPPQPALETLGELRDSEPFDFAYIDVEHDDAAAQRAQEIAGRMNIPVVVFPDGSHQVEPSNDDVEAKLRELSLL